MFKVLEFLVPKNRYFSRIAKKVDFCCVSNKTVTAGFKYAAAGFSVYAAGKFISVALEVQKQNQNFILQKGWLAHEERKLELLRENQKHLWDHAERGAFTEETNKLIGALQKLKITATGAAKLPASSMALLDKIYKTYKGIK